MLADSKNIIAWIFDKNDSDFIMPVNFTMNNTVNGQFVIYEYIK